MSWGHYQPSASRMPLGICMFSIFFICRRQPWLLHYVAAPLFSSNSSPVLNHYGLNYQVTRARWMKWRRSHRLQAVAQSHRLPYARRISIYSDRTTNLDSFSFRFADRYDIYITRVVVKRCKPKFWVQQCNLRSVLITSVRALWRRGCYTKPLSRPVKMERSRGNSNAQDETAGIHTQQHVTTRSMPVICES